jgi:quercetin dioxygenase-like cupin family protein
VRSWDLTSLQAPTPVVVHTEDDARAILVQLEPGGVLGDHQVRERAWVTVVEGEAEFRCDGDSGTFGPGALLMFDPAERHSVRSVGGARILLVLAPWPAEGHYVDGELRRGGPG